MKLLQQIVKFFRNIKFLFLPNYWIMLKPYSKEWDMKLRSLLEHHKFTAFMFFNDEISNATVLLGDVEIWSANHPYASFREYDTRQRSVKNYRASRQTIMNAKAKLKYELPDWPQAADRKMRWIYYAYPELYQAPEKQTPKPPNMH